VKVGEASDSGCIHLKRPRGQWRPDV